jgi:hypothetical protein
MKKIIPDSGLEGASQATPTPYQNPVVLLQPVCVMNSQFKGEESGQTGSQSYRVQPKYSVFWTPPT